jgi:small basic protein
MVDPGDSPAPPANDRAVRVHWWVVSIVQVVMGLSLLAAIYEQQWLNAAVVLGIVGVMLLPNILGKRFDVRIPAEFEVLALVFVFAALFLGEVRGYYERFWWWDIALHTSSGFLLGILGFLLVYVLNENNRVELHMRPHFVALFAFLFSVAMGAVWEIFEFAMDQLLGMNMQKPMFDDPSGLTDTMWDLIVDTVGALIISLLGWWHSKCKTQSFVHAWIHHFVESNPRLFRS